MGPKVPLKRMSAASLALEVVFGQQVADAIPSDRR
jgi:hypothetical protein